MLRLRLPAIACCFLAFTALFVRAQDAADAKAILKKAIEAHGGEKALTKYQGSVSKFKGSMELNNKKLDISGETSFQKPDKLKNALSVEIAGQTIAITQVYDGKKFWINTAGNTTEITDEKLLKEVKESLLTEGASSLAAFLEKPYELNVVGEAKIKGKDAVGIRISKKGQRDISLYFDKNTHLVVKSETRAYDAMSGQEITQEKFVMSYQDKNGLKIGKRLEVHKDGALFMDLEITDVSVVEKLDDTVFAKP